MNRGVTLRHLKPDDAVAHFQAHDKDARRNFYSVPKTLRAARAEVRAAIKQYGLPPSVRKEELFAIDLDGAFAGSVSLHGIAYGHMAVTSYLVAPAFRGQGIATRANKLLLKHAFKTYRLRRIIARVRTFNKASARVLEKAGYLREAVMRNDHRQNGKYYDNYLYAVVR